MEAASKDGKVPRRNDGCTKELKGEKMNRTLLGQRTGMPKL